MKLISVLVAVVVITAANSARAGDKIVLESFTGGKTDEGARVLSPLLDALANRGFVGGYEAVGRKLEQRVSRPVGRNLPADFAAQVEAGHRAWIAGKFEEAVDKLTRVVRAAHDNSGAFAQNQDARELLMKALIALALSQQRIGDPPAMRLTFAELLRSFPNAAVSRATYGPDAVTAFEQTRKELAAPGMGKLTLRSNLDGAVFFINEKIEGRGPIAKDNLLPGEYRVFAQLDNNRLSRSHRVVVEPNGTAAVTIDATFDVVVQTSPAWTGLAFATAGDREKLEVAHAAKFGNALDAEAVAIVGIDQVRGRPSIIGVLVNRQSSTEIRRASVALEPEPSVERMKALAEFLAGENLRPEGIEITVSNQEPPKRNVTNGRGVETPETPSGLWGGWKFVTGGTALAAIGVGAVLLSLDGKCRDDTPPGMQCANLYNTATPAYISIGGGAVLTAVTVYLFIRKDTSSSKTAYVVPTTGGAMAGFAARF